MLLVGASAATLLVVSSVSLSVYQRSLEHSLAAAVAGFTEEQRLADRMNQAVMQQILSISAADLVARGAEVPATFEGAGREVHRALRGLLERPFGLEERLALERLRELHQAVEVSAAMSWNQAAVGNLEAAAEARTRAGLQVLDFMAGLNAFLELRQDELEGIQREQARAFRFIFWSRLLLVLVFVAVFVGIAAWAHRRVTPPLRDLLAASKRVAAGDLATRVARGYDQEFDIVARGFNEMATRLEVARAELEDRNEALSSALEEVRRTQGELILSEKMAALGRVSAGLAHELNNPLASVMGFAELLEHRYAEGDPPAAAEIREAFLRPILAEGGRARDLVRTFLDFSRRGDGAGRPVSVRATVEEVARMREVAFRRSGLAIDVDEVPDAWVEADPELLRSVVLNLVANAFDAMAARGQGTLRVAGYEETGTVHLAFDDDGPGFADVERVFEPFYTTKDPGTGTGLGLALAHRFVERFGGEIRAENRHPRGARVVIRLPALGEPPGAGEDAPASTPVSADGGEPGPARDRENGRATVLVVDDESPIRRLQARILEGMGVEVVEAASAAEARAILEHLPVHAVVSDVRMPGESGIDLYHWVRANRPQLLGRFFFVTGDTSHPELADVDPSRPDMVLHKPFAMTDYRRRLLGAIGSG